MAFTDEQNETIRKDLIREARRCGITIGMRKTSVEQLTNAVGISKGSFYKSLIPRSCCFSPCWRISIPSALRRRRGPCRRMRRLPLPPARQRRSWRRAGGWPRRKPSCSSSKTQILLLHRLPENVKTAHYHDDETHIRALLEAGGLQPKGGMALAAATVRGLILTVSHQEQIGALYPQVLETLVRGACRELFA